MKEGLPQTEGRSVWAHLLTTLDKLRAGDLSGAKEIKLDHLPDGLPDELFALSDTLEVLDLGGAGLNALPDDFARLKNLKILFATDNRFDRFPDVLSECPSLDIVSFKSNGMTEIPEGTLPPGLRWLIMTDNKLPRLPDDMGHATRLQKCMLAGNQLTELPASMATCENLQLLRISANRFDALPDFLFELPKLSWLAIAGNPFHRPFHSENKLPSIPLSKFDLHEILGKGASGTTYRATLTTDGRTEFPDWPDAFAIKIFKPGLTSDGYSKDELSACLAAGSHPAMVSYLAQCVQDDEVHLVMDLIAAEYINLGLPPNFETCSRDRYTETMRFPLQDIRSICLNAARLMHHLHGRGIAHGDIYAHNMLVNNRSETLTGDFGAASNLASLPQHQRDKLERIEIRALGCLFEDLLSLASDAESQAQKHAHIAGLTCQMMHPDADQRPTLQDIIEALSDSGPLN